MLLAASGLVAIAPTASAALSTGCQAVDDDGSFTGSRIYWQQVSGGYTFSTGETLKITYSSPGRTPTTAHISLGTSAADGVPASYSSKVSTTTFPATLTYTLDQDYTFLMFEIDDGNVDMVYECGIAQTITFANPGDQEMPTGTVNLTATADSGLTVSLASSTTSVCTVSGTTLTLVDEGTCTITASQAGSGDYLAADDVERSFTVSKASQTITFADPGSKALSLGSFTASSSADSGLTVSMASSTGSVCSVTGFTVSLLATGTCTLTASQAGNSNYDAATNVERSFSVTASSGGGGGGGVGAPAPAPAPPAPAPTTTGTTTTAALTWTPDSDREKYVSSGSGVEISAEALAPTGGKRAVDDGDAFALVDGDDIELDIKGLADDSTLTVSFTFADPDRPECAIKSQEIEVRSGTTLTESSIPFDPADQCVGEWTMTLEGQTSSSTAFKFTTPIVLAAKQLVTETLDAKASYFFKGRSDAFHTKSPRKLTRLANSVPEKADVTIAVTGVSVSLKGKKANKALAKKRCEQIEEFMREALPGHTLTFEHNPVGARKRGGDVSTDAILLRNKRGKPLTTVSVTYTTLR